MSRTLFAITEDLHALDQLLDEIEGDVSDPKVAAAVEAWMSELDRDLEGKVDNYAAFITELGHRSEARRTEAARLARRAEIDLGTMSFLKDRLKLALQQRNIQKLETPRYKVTIAGNGGKQPIDIHDPAAVPATYHDRIPERFEINADRVREALSKGFEVPGAVLMNRGTHLRIK